MCILVSSRGDACGGAREDGDPCVTRELTCARQKAPANYSQVRRDGSGAGKVDEEKEEERYTERHVVIASLMKFAGIFGAR